jgi:nucleotide-binding universal stress UspA family protein
MKYVVAYNGSDSSRRALALGVEHAKKDDAMLYVVYSMEGGANETIEDIQYAEEQLEAVKKDLGNQDVRFETVQLVRGLAPGEDIVQYTKENAIDHIFIGIEKKSRTRKLLLGSTAQFIILRGPCPVTTIK